MKKNKAKSSEFLEMIQEQSKGHNAITADAFVFLYHIVTGAIDKAFDWIETAMKNKSFQVPLRFADPITKLLRRDQRYTELEKIIYRTEEEKRPIKKKKPLLDSKMADKYIKILLSHIQNDQPYLDPELTLRSLSEQLEIQPNQLSWLINEQLGKNFNEFINHYRIETFKTLVQVPANAGITIMGLAYDSGFNSKTTFNTSFKKETGLTPKEFLKA